MVVTIVDFQKEATIFEMSLNLTDAFVQEQDFEIVVCHHTTSYLIQV